MDPFQIRLDFLSLLRRLTASQQSIAKLVAFANVHAPKARNDIWDCIVSETAKANLNARLNILFLIDALVSSSGAPTTSSAQGGYLDLAARDLREIMALVVPDTRDGVQLNAGSALRVLATWHAERVFSSALIKDAEQDITARQSRIAAAPREEQRSSDLSEADVLRRIEEDRERHKRLRERGWILPSKSFIDALPSMSGPRASSTHLRPGPSHSTKTSPASPREPPGPPRASGVKRPGQTALPAAKRARPAAPADDAAPDGPALPDPFDVEFDELWETVSDLNEDDLETIQEDDAQWWGSETALFQRAEEERQAQEARRLEEERAQQAAVEEASRLRRLQEEEEERQQRLALRQANEAQRGAERNGSAHSSSPARGWNTSRASHEQRGPPAGPASSGFAGRGGRGFRPIGAPTGPASMLNGHGHAGPPAGPAAGTPPRNGAFGHATPPAAPSSFSRSNLGASRSSSPYTGPPAGPGGRGGTPGRFRGAGGPRRGGWRDAR